MSSLPARMRIDAWSDVVFPWCAIGKAHLEQALAGFEQADRVEVVWRGFEFAPGAPATREGSYEASLAATAVPTSLVDGRVVIPRAQSAESMLATLRRGWGSVA